MAERSYQQFCGLAGALDLIGERWTILVVRELMTGPKRYTDLLSALDGIGTSLLAQRLKRLEAAAILERKKLGPPAGSVVYELTPTGEELADALVPLTQWGLRHTMPAEPTPGMNFQPHWTLVAFTHPAHPEALQGLEASYEFEVEGEKALLTVRDGKARMVPLGSVTRPDVRVRLGAKAVAALGAGRLSVEDALVGGHLEVEGDEAAIAGLAAAFEA